MDQASRLRDMVGNGKGVEEKLMASNATADAHHDGTGVRVISVTSGKGGVGKTNVVANLALALTQSHKKVLILDADLGLGNMDVLLGLNHHYSIQHVLTGEKRLEEIIIEAPGGFQVLPAASGIQELTELDQSQRLFLLDELDILQDRFDVLLIDTGAGISSNVMYFNFAAMEKVVVVTNEPASLTDAYALIKVLTTKYQQKTFKILINQARNAEEADRIFRQLSQVVDKFLGSPSIDYLGWIPHDKHIPQAVRQQQAVLAVYPDAAASKSFLSVAESLLTSVNHLDFEGDIKFFWKKLVDSWQTNYGN
ncbi:MAG: flagellar synthesis regulator FleN [Deltaproteobacteria bacterium]|nr:MAG: flagellar synthesis regulator FleN [Deltaproteobacteria bacterium]